MDIIKLTELIAGNDFAKIQVAFTSAKPKFKVEQPEALKQYKVPEHEIFDTTKRPDKTIKKDTGQVNEAGEPVLASAIVPVARVGMPFQKLIVDRRVGFMLSDPVQVKVEDGDDSTQEQELVKLITRIQNENKMDYKNKEIARRLMSEMEAAEIWYFVPNENPAIEAKFILKMRVVSPDLGDTLYPMFDPTGDMIAFARSYKVNDEGKDTEHFDIYLAENEYYWIMDASGKWTLDPLITPNPKPNQVKKIMVIYYSQQTPEWADVQTMISRLETIVSNHADVNDYFGSPILTVIGELAGYAQKGETGKILQLTQGSQANYLALATEPASIAMEKDNLEAYIYSMSQTPNITFAEMKGLGALSGVALKLLFMDAHMAVKNKEETFGLGLQRRLNLLKASAGLVVNTSLAKVAEVTQIKPVLTPFLPENVTEAIDNLASSIQSGMMSTETALENHPLIADVQTELDRLAKEKEEAMTAMQDQAALQAGGGFQSGETGAEQGAEGGSETGAEETTE